MTTPWLMSLSATCQGNVFYPGLHGKPLIHGIIYFTCWKKVDEKEDQIIIKDYQLLKQVAEM